jgi:hypothetical protein
VLLLGLLLTLGCTGRDQASGGTQGRPDGDPQEYFPIAMGTTWTYDITIGPGEPLSYQTRKWPMGEKAMVQSVRGRYWGAMKHLEEGKTSSLKLKLRVAGRTTECPMATANAVKVDVVQDDLGIFEDAEALYFTRIGDESDCEWVMVTSYGMHGIGAPTGSWGMPLSTDNGFSNRLIFFGDGFGIRISLGGASSEDHLLCVGLDQVRRGARNVELVRFTRTVDPRSDDDSEADVLNKGFTEDTWYQRGRGLVRLEQTIDGQRTMTWELATDL